MYEQIIENLMNEDRGEFIDTEKITKKEKYFMIKSALLSIESKNLSIIRRINRRLGRVSIKEELLKLRPVVSPFKNRIFRYSLSFILVSFVIYFYIMFEGHRNEETVRILFFDFPSNLLVPLGLVFAFIAALLLTWDDPFFGKYRSPALYMILLTAIFYALIYSGVDSFLFQLKIAEWLTKATGVIVTALMYVFGLNLVDSSWVENTAVPHRSYTLLIFDSPNGIKNIAIDARCSGIHSLTIFLAIFLLMLFESRNRLKWNWKVILVTSFGVIGTYLINILRVNVILFVFYFRGWDIAEPIHNYLGYALLIMWIPIYWLFILPKAEKSDKLKDDVYVVVSDSSGRTKLISEKNIVNLIGIRLGKFLTAQISKKKTTIPLIEVHDETSS